MWLNNQGRQAGRHVHVSIQQHEDVQIVLDRHPSAGQADPKCMYVWETKIGLAFCTVNIERVKAHSTSNLRRNL